MNYAKRARQPEEPAEHPRQRDRLRASGIPLRVSAGRTVYCKYVEMMALLLAGHTGAFALYGPQHSEYTPVVGSVSAHEARAPSLGLGGDDLGAQQGELALLLDEALHQLDRELRLLRRVVLGAALLRRARGEGSAGGGSGATLEGPIRSWLKSSSAMAWAS